MELTLTGGLTGREQESWSQETSAGFWFLSGSVAVCSKWNSEFCSGASGQIFLPGRLFHIKEKLIKVIILLCGTFFNFYFSAFTNSLRLYSSLGVNSPTDCSLTQERNCWVLISWSGGEKYKVYAGWTATRAIQTVGRRDGPKETLMILLCYKLPHFCLLSRLAVAVLMQLWRWKQYLLVCRVVKDKNILSESEVCHHPLLRSRVLTWRPPLPSVILSSYPELKHFPLSVRITRRSLPPRDATSSLVSLTFKSPERRRRIWVMRLRSAGWKGSSDTFRNFKVPLSLKLNLT